MDFLIDNGIIKSYDDLVKDIHQSDYFYIYRYDNIYDLFVNLLIGLLSDNDIYMIDNDLSDDVIKEYKTMICKEKEIISFLKAYNSIDDIILKIRKSKSKIYLFTSGTTGKPKKIAHTFDSLTRFVKNSSKLSQSVWGFAYNPTHIAGLQVFFQAFLNKNTIVNLFQDTRDSIYSKLKDHSVTHISATPTFYRLLIDNLCNVNFSEVQRVTLGGEKSSQKLYSSINKLFPNAVINNIYASTEVGSLFVSHGENFKIPEAVYNKVIVDNNELCLHKSLFNNDIVEKEDYFRTGDLIEWVNKENREFRFVARKSSFINVGGYNVNPEEIEDELLNYPEIINARVYPRKNSILGNVMCAEIVLSKGQILSEKQIRERLINNFQEYKIPRIIKFVTSIKLTRTGKNKK